MSKVEDFELPYESVMRTAKVYDQLAESLDLSKEMNINELNSLIWGRESPRTFKLWKINKLEFHCSNEKM